MLEPVPENYMGAHVSFATPQPKQKKPVAETKQAKSSLNPRNFFLKLRDRYIRTLNDMAMSGDYTGMAGFGHGYSCNATMDNTREHYRFNEEREIIALQEELAALRRNRQEQQEFKPAQKC